MVKKNLIPHAELAELLDWLEKADNASSYDGFRFSAWAAQRPKTAIEIVRQHQQKRAK